MDRRKSIKTLLIGTASAGVVLDACQPGKQPETAEPSSEAADADRMAEEIANNKKISEERFFTDAEMATITILSDIIIPKDAISGSASEAGVPAFIEFIVKDMPQHQVPMRGGLRWLELESLKRFGRSFTACSEKERLLIADDIAFPDKAAPAYQQGVAFFSLMRNLTASGFYTSPLGLKDIGYAGNQPNQWNGVPEDVLKMHGISYTEKELRECIRFDQEG
jgi:hypothetical protein